jgi:rubrerythrin
VVRLVSTDTRAAATILRGTREPYEYRCSGCGYGIVVRQLPDACPMCRGAAWELSELSKLSAG